MRSFVIVFLIFLAGSVFWLFTIQGLALDQEENNLTPQASLKEKVHEGNALFLKGDLEGALLRYQEVLKEATGAAEAKIHYNLANALTRLGRLEDAQREYKEALRIDPKSEDAKYNLEVAYLAKEGKEAILRPQAEIEGASELDQQILQILQVLERKEFGLPKGVPQPPSPPEPQSKRQGKDW